MDTNRYSINLLYWYKSTNTDAAAQENALFHAALRAAPVQQRLASQLECVAPAAGLSLAHLARVRALSLASNVLRANWSAPRLAQVRPHTLVA